MNRHPIRTILWLRWCLSRNQWRRGSVFSALAGMLFLIGGGVLAAACAVGGFLGGMFLPAEAPGWVVMLIWDGVIAGFLLFWLVGLVTEVQRSASVDVGKLLHLPVSLRDIFLTNYVASHVTPAIVILLPGMLGLAIGMMVSRGPWMCLLIPLIACFVFPVTAWTTCLRGWLLSLMINPRRRRAILLGLTVGIILVVQLPNLYFNILRPQERQRPGVENRARDGEPGTRREPGEFFDSAPVILLHRALPPLWLSAGAAGLANGNPWPALLGMGGGMLLGGLGLRRAYRGARRFHLGIVPGVSRGPERVEAGRERQGVRLVEWSVPGIPAEASAMTFAFLRSMLRAPEIKFALFMPAVMVLVMGGIFLSRSGGRVEALTPFLPSLGILWVLFGMVQLCSNHFGFDREGFRALVLLPARRRDVLLAKNLALLPMVSGMGLVLLGAMAVATGLEPWLVMAGALEMVAAFLAISLAGNVTSIVCPYRIGAGTLKASKMPVQTKLWLFVMHLLFPLVMIPLMMPAGLQLLAGRLLGWPEPLVRLGADAVLLGLALGVYWVSLRGMGEWLQRREQAILQVVTQEVE